MADTCTSGILDDIISDCTTQKTGGIEVVAWAFNRADLIPTIDSTYKNKVTNLVIADGKKGYYIKGVKKLLDSGHEIVINEKRADTFKHKFSLQGFEQTAEASLNFDNLQDLVIVYERKEKANLADGTFVIRGLEKGLYKSADTLMESAEDGSRVLELASLDGQAEPVSEWILLVPATPAPNPVTAYENTKALLLSLMTVAP